jgi:O-antigen ligase
MALQRTLLYSLIAILVAAPLPFGSVQRGASLRLCAACLLLGVVWIAWRTRFGLPPLPWRDPALAAGAFIFLFALVQIVPLPEPALETISPAAVSLRAAYEPPPAPGDHGLRPISLDPAATRLAALKWLACLIALLVTVDLAGRRAARGALATGLVVGGGVQAIYGLAEYLSGRQHIFGYAKKYYTDVATGTFINRNHYAGYLEMTLPLAVAALAAALARLRSRPGATLGERLANASGRDLFTSGLLLLLSLVMATALACSRSRMGIASAALALAATGVVLTWKGGGRGFAAAAVVVAGATLLLFAQGGAGVPILDRFAIAVSEFQGSLGRREMWTQALGMASQFSLAGVGLGAFASVFPAFRTSGPGIALTHAHNDYLEWLTEAGLIGCAVLLVCLAIVAVPIMKRRAGRSDFGLVGHAAITALVAIGLHSLTDFNLEMPANALTLAVVAGLALAWRRASVPVLADERAAQAGWIGKAWAPATILVGLGLALTLSAGAPEKTFRMAARLETDAMGDLEALAQAGASGPAPSALAVAYIQKRLDEARALQMGALRRLPTSSTGHLGLARLHLEDCAAASMSGRSAQECAASALREFRAATGLGPMDASLHAQVARILLGAWPLFDESGRDQARSMIDRAVALNPGDRDLAGARLAMAADTGDRT